MGWVLDRIGKLIARYLEKPVAGYEPFTPSEPEGLRQSLRPGDVLLVEGANHVSGVIKYLTQSTWSHSALYVGPIAGLCTSEGEPHVLIEANIGEGVVSAPLSKYYRFHTRICRPVGLSKEDADRVCRYAIERIGFDYDLKNIIDLMRFLFPTAAADRARVGRPHADHLFFADRSGVRSRALSHSAQGHAARKQDGAARHPGNPPFLAVLPARFRHFTVFQGGETHAPQGL
jgi:hypothetical protein